MADEIYDVLDKAGKVIGQATWTEVHRDGLLHPTASVLIFKDASREEVLIQRRNPNMAQEPGLLSHSAGGHMLAGQTPEEGIRKEISEELFSDGPIPEMQIRYLSCVDHHDFDNNFEHLHIFEAIYPGPFNYDAKELAEEPTWMRFEDVHAHQQKHPELYTISCGVIMNEYVRLRDQSK